MPGEQRELRAGGVDGGHEADARARGRPPDPVPRGRPGTVPGGPRGARAPGQGGPGVRRDAARDRLEHGCATGVAWSRGSLVALVALAGCSPVAPSPTTPRRPTTPPTSDRGHPSPRPAEVPRSTTSSATSTSPGVSRSCPDGRGRRHAAGRGAGSSLVGPDGAATDVTGPGADQLGGPRRARRRGRPARGRRPRTCDGRPSTWRCTRPRPTTTGSCAARSTGRVLGELRRSSPGIREGGQPRRRPARGRPGRLPLRDHGRRGQPAVARRTRTASTARSCASRPTATRRPGNPDEGIAGVEPRAPQRAGPRLGARRSDVRLGVRPEHVGRAQPDRAGRQLRLARGRGESAAAGSSTRGRRGPTDRRVAERARRHRRGASTSPGCAGERLWRVPLTEDGVGTPAGAARGRARPAARGRAGARRVAVGGHGQHRRPRRPARRRRPHPAGGRRLSRRGALT